MRQCIKLALYSVLVLGLTVASVPQPSRAAETSRQASVQPSPPKPQVHRHILHHAIYTDRRYGFRFYLPKSWKGYSILETEWEGSGNSEPTLEEHGPLIEIRHPLWTEDKPREDIPIMVFTSKQWRAVEGSTLIVSAAPFGPSEIGRNSKYVFATPPRFSSDYLDGWEEVLKILRGGPLHPLLSAGCPR